MKTGIFQRIVALAAFPVIIAALFQIAGCSLLQIQQGLRNASAADCSTATTQQAFVNNLPPNPFVSTSQELAIVGQVCYADFGTVAAPATAPGNVPMIPAAPAIPVPSAAATPAPAA